MTRHGLVQALPAGAPPPATDPRASTVTIVASSVARSIVRAWLDRAEAPRSGLSASIPTLPFGGCAVADIGRRSKSP
jgi:hypothetical protein